MSDKKQAVHLDGPVRRTKTALAAALIALLIALLLLIVPVVLRAAHGSQPDAVEAGLLLLGLGAVALGLVATLLAFIAVVRDRGTSRLGAFLLLCDAVMQAIFGLIGISSTTMQGTSDMIYNAAWVTLSLFGTLIACIFIFMPPMPLTRSKEARLAK